MTNVRYGTLACLKITFFFKGDGFLLGFNPYISPEENQVNYGDDQDLHWLWKKESLFEIFLLVIFTDYTADWSYDLAHVATKALKKDQNFQKKIKASKKKTKASKKRSKLT